jgi:CHASE2 domain-containing sensor protein/signal transduction histidine kinase
VKAFPPDRRLRTEWWWIALLISVLAVALTFDRTLVRFDNLVYDHALRLDRQPSSGEILLVAIDEESLGRVGRWPWPRDMHARLIDALGQAKPRAIAYDVLFLEPGPETDDERLGAAIARAGPLFVPLAIAAPGRNGAAFDALEPIPAVRTAASGIGHVNLNVDPDGVVRRAALAFGSGEQRRLHLMALMHGSADPALPRSDGTIGQDPVLIPFFGATGHWPTVSAASVLAGEIPPELLRDRLIIVGATAYGLGDRFPVPAGEIMPGIEIQAHLLEGLLTGRMIAVPGTAALLALALVPLWWLLLTFRHLPHSAALPTLAGAVILVLLASTAALVFFRIWLPPGAALAGLCISYPLWAWRQLASADSFMTAELDRFREESAFLPHRVPAASETSRLESTIPLLRQAIADARELRHFVSDRFDQLPDATIVTDMAGRVVLSNTAATQLFDTLGVPVADWKDIEPLLARFHQGPDRELIQVPARDTQEDRAVEPLETEAGTDDGRFFSIRFVPQTSAGGPQIGWLVHFIDVSEARAAQRQREDILQLLTHDMRSPQASILAVIEIAQPDQIDARVAGRIRNYAQRTLDLADGFVQLARAEVLAYATEEIDLSDILMDAIDELWPQLTAKKIELENAGTQEQLVVRGERSLLTRALVNVIGNAVKYSDAEKRITCTLARRTGDGGESLATCAIADEGPGLEPEHHRIIFERFCRGPQGIARKPDGVGLGLSFAHTVVTRHKGKIECASEPGKGSIFTIVLPMIA